MYDMYVTLTHINYTCKAAMNKYIHVSKIRHCNMCKSYTTEILNTLGVYNFYFTNTCPCKAGLIR